MPRLRTIAASLLVITALFSTAACGGSDDASDAKASAIDGILTEVASGLDPTGHDCLKSNLEELSTDQVTELRDAFAEAGVAFNGNIPTELLPADLADKATAIAQECIGTEAPANMVTVETE